MSRLDTDPFGPEETALLVQAAARAPSIHNTRPWRFRVDRDRVEVHAEESRALAAADPAGRQRTISCGAATLNLRLAMTNLGFLTHTVLLPDPAEPGHLATVVRGRRHPPSQTEHRLFQALPHRRTHYQAFLRVPTSPESRERLHAAAAQEGAWTRESGPHDRDEFTATVVRAVTTLVTDPGYRAELARWSRIREESPDDIPPAVPPAQPGGGPHPVGPSRPYLLPPAVSPERIAADGLLTTFVLGTDGDEPADWLRAGQALQRLLLTATDDGLVAALFSQVVEVPTARRRLVELLDLPGPPQAVLRVGYAAIEVPATRRGPT